MSSPERVTMPALALISDLMMQSQVTGAARGAGVELTIATTEDALVAQAEALRPRLIIVDLTHPGLDPGALVARLRAIVGSEATRLAFGPHVHKQRLAGAVEAGFDVVLSRGQFHAEMAELLQRLGR